MSSESEIISTQKKLADMVEKKEKASYNTIKEMFADLEPATNDFMIGQWRGGTFNDSGSENFYGKRFNSVEHCEPMLRTREDGTIYVWPDWGEARLREVSFLGKVQSTVIYDDKPIMDYFRKINDNLVLGLGDWKGNPKLYFWLQRDI